MASQKSFRVASPDRVPRRKRMIRSDCPETCDSIFVNSRSQVDHVGRSFRWRIELHENRRFRHNESDGNFGSVPGSKIGGADPSGDFFRSHTVLLSKRVKWENLHFDFFPGRSVSDRLRINRNHEIYAGFLPTGKSGRPASVRGTATVSPIPARTLELLRELSKQMMIPKTFWRRTRFQCRND